MTIPARTTLLALGLTLAMTAAVGLGACSHSPSGRHTPQEVAATPHHAHSLWSLHQARGYMSQGRYVLAREHLRMGLATAGDPALRETLNRELAAVNEAIRSRR